MNFKRSFRIVSSEENIKQIQDIEGILEAENYTFEQDIFFPNARKCTHEPKALGSSLAHYFGYIYIQDRASMLPPIALSPEKSAIVLDMCASPGSKTSMLSHMLDEKALVIGNEPNSTRLANLRRNLELMQCFNAVTCNYSGEKIPLADKSFDYILLDPPCSGWGTIDKNPNVKEIWTVEKAKNLVDLQRKLLSEAARLLKIGGQVVYSTCTTNIQENEEQVQFAVENLGLEQEELLVLDGFDVLPPQKNVKNVWRLDVKHNDTQGFFVAKFTKKEHIPQERSLENIQESKHFEMAHLPQIDSENGEACIFGKNAYFVPHKARALAEENKHFKFQGMQIGKASLDKTIISPRLRVYEHSAARDEAIHFETKNDLQIIYGLLNGQSLDCEKKSTLIPFYWKDLYLGNLTKKGKRLLWTIK